MWVRQGFSWIQNFVSNSALRILTDNPKAKIVQSVVPVNQRSFYKDDYETILISIYSYISITLFIIPMYFFIQRIQTDKQSGLNRHLQI